MKCHLNHDSKRIAGLEITEGNTSLQGHHWYHKVFYFIWLFAQQRSPLLFESSEPSIYTSNYVSYLRMYIVPNRILWCGLQHSCYIFRSLLLLFAALKVRSPLSFSDFFQSQELYVKTTQLLHTSFIHSFPRSQLSPYIIVIFGRCNN
jgi:hypothetical protein